MGPTPADEPVTQVAVLPERLVVRLLLVFAAAAGSLDVVCVTRLGGPFASVITGNLVQLGRGVATPDGRLAVGATAAVAGYALGVASGTAALGRGVDRMAQARQPDRVGRAGVVGRRGGRMAGHGRATRRERHPATARRGRRRHGSAEHGHIRRRCTRSINHLPDGHVDELGAHARRRAAPVRRHRWRRRPAGGVAVRCHGRRTAAAFRPALGAGPPGSFDRHGRRDRGARRAPR